MDGIRDRGIIKWPSCLNIVQMLKEYQNDFQKKILILDEYQLQEIDEKINTAIEYHLPVIIETWQNGYVHVTEGVIEKVV